MAGQTHWPPRAFELPLFWIQNSTNYTKPFFKKSPVFKPTTYWSSVRSENHYTNKTIVSGRHRKVFSSIHSYLNGSSQILLVRHIQHKIGKTRITCKTPSRWSVDWSADQVFRIEPNDSYDNNKNITEISVLCGFFMTIDTLNAHTDNKA